MIVARSRADLIQTLDELPRPLGLVMTMGALHPGHASLMEHARRVSESVLVTVFVNPLQFAANEDLATYPRTLDDDLAVCDKVGVDAVWAPSVEDVYPSGPVQVRIEPGPLGAQLEGAARPEHFGGVLTVVGKFFGQIRPTLAFFGEKDYQQLTLVRRMAGDLEMGVAVVGVPTVREPDGLALSSRNTYLAPDERARAQVLSRALSAGRAAASDDGGVAGVLAAARAVLDTEPDVHVDYLELRDPDLGAAPASGAARLLVAARVGRTRLIDNVEVTL